MKLAEVLKILASNRKELDQFKVSSIAVFGSVARNEAKDSSDVDILVEFSEAVDFFEFLDLKEFLEQLLKRKVDLVTKEALKKQLRDRILKEAVRAA